MQAAIPEYKAAERQPLLPGYTMDIYQASVGSRLLDSYALLKHSIGDDVLKLDHGFKLDNRGVLTVMTSTNLNIGNWMGSAAVSDVLPGLYCLFQRLQALGYDVKVLFSDNPRALVNKAPQAFPSLGKGLHDGDDGNHGDHFHMYSKLRESMTPDHSLAHPSLEDLQKRLSIAHPDDLQPGCCHDARVLFPPPHLLLPAFVGWLRDWHNRVDATGACLFTAKTVSCVNLIMEDIIHWRFSGEYRTIACMHR